MILVTAAAGHAGSAMVKGLVDKGYDVVATDIDPKVKELPGIKKAMVGNLDDLDFQKQLVASCDQIVYIPPVYNAQDDMVGNSMIDLAVQAKIKQFVLISVIHPILTTLLQHTTKRKIEEHLVYTGMNEDMPYTILQPTHYMYNFPVQLVNKTNEYQMFFPVDKKQVAWVDQADVAEVLTKVVADPQKYNKADYELVGTERLSCDECVAIFNKVTGKNAKAVYVPVKDFLDEMHVTDIASRVAITHLADTYTKWGLDGNTSVLEWQLGRQPTSFEDYVKREMNL